MRLIGAQVEKRICPLLTADGIRYFIAREKTIKKYADGHKEQIIKPIVGGLIFLYGTVSVIEEQIRHYGGRLQWMYQRGKSIDKHMIVPTEEMENFIRAINSKLESITYISPSEAANFLGKRVRLHGGPLDGVEGVLAESRGKTKRIVVKAGAYIAIEIKVIPEVIEILDNKQL